MSKELYANSALHRFVRYDARSEILRSVGDVSGIELFGTQLLVAPYVRSGILLSQSLGIPEAEVLCCEALYDLYESGKGFMAQKFATEDIFQGKVCLVLAIGKDLLDGEDRRRVSLTRLDDIKERLHHLATHPYSVADAAATHQEHDELISERDELQADLPKPLDYRVGDWVFTLQENTRGVSISAPGAQQSRVLKALGIDYVGWPSKFLYSVDVYGRVNDPNILA